jgi:hypothetical protein
MLPYCKAFALGGPTRDAENIFMQGLCSGSVEGIAYMLTGNAECANIPTAITEQKLVEVVVRYIEELPEKTQVEEPFNRLAQFALKKAWPC